MAKLKVTLINGSTVYLHAANIYIKDRGNDEAIQVLIDGDWFPIKEDYPAIAYQLRNV